MATGEAAERRTPETVRPDAAPILGRDAELARLHALVDAVGAADGGALVLSGEGGIGKTTLLDHAAAVARAAGITVGAARGVEGEQNLAFAALADALRPFVDAVDDLPEPQRRALRSALALGPGATPDAFATCVAALALVGAAARTSPVLLVVDDAHLLDAPSAQALGFVARRVAHDRVGVLVARRSSEPSVFDAAGLEELTLAGLTATDAAVLVARVSAGAVSTPVVEQLVAATAGNPLALQEVAGALDADELTGARPLTEPLTVGPAVQRTVGRRVAALDEDARRAALVVAADPSVPAGTVLKAGARLGVAAAAFTVAETSGVVVLDGGRFRFAHPLVRAAVYSDAPPEVRRAVHAALAAELDGEADATRRAWHLARAAFGPDEAAAAALDAAAAQASRQGAHASAARALARAAELTLDPAAASARWGGAGHAALLAGDLASAVLLCDRAVETAADPLSRALSIVVRAAPRYWTLPARRQHDVLITEADEVGAVDPSLAGVLIVLAGASRGHRGRHDRGCRGRRRGARTVGRPGSRPARGARPRRHRGRADGAAGERYPDAARRLAAAAAGH